MNGGSIGCIETNGTVTCSCTDEGCNKDRNTAENSAEETINKLDVMVGTLEKRKKDLEGHQQLGNRTEEQHQTNATTEGQDNANMTVLANPEAVPTNEMKTTEKKTTGKSTAKKTTKVTGKKETIKGIFDIRKETNKEKTKLFPKKEMKTTKKKTTGKSTRTKKYNPKYDVKWWG